MITGYMCYQGKETDFLETCTRKWKRNQRIMRDSLRCIVSRKIADEGVDRSAIKLD